MNTESSKPARPPRDINMVKWSLGCVGVAMVLCTGVVMLGLIVTPIAFRSLSPETQDKFIRHFPFTSNFMPTQPVVVLPTNVAKNGDALALLATPTQTVAVVSSPTPVGGDLSIGAEGSASKTPLAPTSTAIVDSSAASPTPVLAQPTELLSTVVPTLAPTAIQVVAPVAFHNDGYVWVPQGWNNCGPANVTQVLKSFSWQGTQDQAAAYLKPNREDKNVSPWQIVKYVNDNTGIKALQRVGGDLTTIKRLVSQKFGVILETGYDVAGEGWMGHYLTVIGYDDNQSLLYGLDTYLGDGKDNLGYHEQYEDIDRRWQMFNRLYMVFYPKEREGELAALLGSDADLNYNWQHALNVAKLDASSRPNNPYAWFNIGSSYVLLRQYKEAATAFDQAQSVGGLPFRMLWYQFTPYEAYYNTGNYSQVLALVQASLATTTYVEETYYWKAMAEAAQGQIPLAEADFQRVLKFNPNFVLATDRLTDIQNGKFAPPAVAQATQ